MGTLESIMDEITKGFQPLVRRIENREAVLLFEELGLRLPVSAISNTAFNTSLTQLTSEISITISKIDALKKAVEDKDEGAIISTSIEALTHLKAVFEDLKTVSNSLKNDIGAAAIGISGIDMDDFVSKLPRRLAEYLLVTNLENNFDAAADILEFLGVIIRTDIEDTGNAALPDFTKREVDFSALLHFITHPGKHLEEKFDWNKPAFDGSKLFKILAKVLLSRGIPVLYDEMNSPNVINVFFADISIDNGGPVPGLLIKPSIDSYDASFHTKGEAWKFNAALDLSITNDAQVSIFPDGNVKVNMPGFGGGKISADFEAGYTDKKLEILGISGGSRIEADSFKISIENTIDTSGSGVFSFTGELNKIHVIVDLSEGDGFTKKVGGSGFDSEIDLKFGYSTKAGFFIEGSGAFEVRVPTHITLGPIDITALTVKLSPAEGKLPISIGGDIRASLGPLVAIINNIGFTLTLASRDDNSGNLGRIQVTPGFKSPEGIGLSIDAGGFKGGGILDFDNDNKEYFGGMELEFKDLFSIKAFAIINTRMPDGSDDFSLLIIITAEFTPIQLGFGFTLNGVGGLFGYNRTVKLDILKEGIKTNAIESILFPQDIVANINRIVSDIKQVFPPQHGRFFICPMGKLGWGTPTLITLELGILIEIPATGFAILGVLKALLPDQDAPLLKLQVNFVGIIDFENKYISFDAILFDSRLLTFTISGQMALRIAWGDKPIFILSVGGFHPAFKEIPVDLQNMQRVTISLLNESDARLSIQTYFAVTSNTAQFGARAELYAEEGGFNIYGFIGYDVLFQFDPFKFIADFSAGIALRRHTSVIMSISVSGTLSGPGHWDARGEASISFFFFSISVSFHKSWGDSEGNSIPDKADILALLTKEINDNRNWKADIPANNKLHVSIRKIETEGDTIAVHPFGILTFSERLVPLDLDINKFGNQVPKDATNFGIETTDSSLFTAPVTEQFAPANFTQMSDEDKLARPSFEQMKSGFKITNSSALKVPSENVIKDVDYEFSYLGRPTKHKYQYPKSFFQANLKGSAVAQSTLSFVNNRISVNAPEAVNIQEEQFAVANMSDMKLHSNKMVAGSYTETLQFYNTLIKEKPELKNRVQIVSQYELNAN
jgi:hypothetical protein